MYKHANIIDDKMFAIFDTIDYMLLFIKLILSLQITRLKYKIILSNQNMLYYMMCIHVKIISTFKFTIHIAIISTFIIGTNVK